MAIAEPVFNRSLPDFHANPYPFHNSLLNKDPVHQSPKKLAVTF
jgi:hypothetical protein